MMVFLLYCRSFNTAHLAEAGNCWWPILWRAQRSPCAIYR